MPPLTPDELLKALIELKRKSYNKMSNKNTDINNLISLGEFLAYDKVINLINEKK